jgi:hypothetical protein
VCTGEVRLVVDKIGSSPSKRGQLTLFRSGFNDASRDPREVLFGRKVTRDFAGLTWTGGIDDNIGGMAERGSFGLTGGPLASDFILGGCSNTQCIVAGFWQSDLAVPVPEPISAVLLITGLLGACLARLRA